MARWPVNCGWHQLPGRSLLDLSLWWTLSEVNYLSRGLLADWTQRILKHAEEG